MKKIATIFLLLFPSLGFATHLVGGCIELKWISGDNYRITARIIRDCENGNPGAYFDNPISIGIFEKGTHIKKNQFSLSFSTLNDDTLKFTGDNCANIVTGCTHIGTYISGIITLNSNQYNSNNGYYLSWQRCCRNGIINNIINPGDAAMTLYTEVPNLKTVKNSSPRYTNNPNTLLCASNLFEYNMNFTDDDGDELRYSLIEPLNGNLDRNQPASTNATAGPYSTIVWQNGFNNNEAINGTVPLSINSGTGLISCNPSTPGIYVASIRVEEYRFGQKIGELRLELQFTVTICPNNPPISSVIYNSQLLLVDTVEIQIPEKACFDIRAIDPSDSLYLTINSDSLDSTYKDRPVFDSISSGYRSVVTTICWQSSCELEKLKKTVPFFVYVQDNGCPISKNVSSKFWVKFLPMPLVNQTGLLCMNLIDNKEIVVYYGDTLNPANPYFDSYLVYRGINNKNFVVIDTIRQIGLRQFTDKNAPNYGQLNYSYFMVGVNKCGVLGPHSDTLTSFEQIQALPNKQYIKYVTVANNNHLELEWLPSAESDFAKFYLYKAAKGRSNFKMEAVFENPTDVKYADYQVTVSDTAYCYYVIMRDTCDNYGPIGETACSMVLSGKSAEFKSNLSWLPYEGWRGGIESYQIFRADPADSFSQIGSTQNIPRFTDSKLNLNEGLYYYYVTAKEKMSPNILPFFDASSHSNTILLYQSPIVYAPNAFTANGDGLNDQFKWVPVFVKDFNIRIFNRWGQQIFETNNKNQPWDGNLNGEPCQQDVYFYIIRYTGWEGSDKTHSGNFTLMR